MDQHRHPFFSVPGFFHFANSDFKETKLNNITVSILKICDKAGKNSDEGLNQLPKYYLANLRSTYL
jgi:hypothetical protein